MFFSATVCFETHIIHPWGCIRKYNALTLAYTGTHNGSFSPHLMQAFCHLFGGCLSLSGLEKCFHEYGLIQITKYKVTFKGIQCVYIEVCISAILLLAPFTPRYALHTQTPLCAMPIKSDYFYSAFFCRRI